MTRVTANLVEWIDDKGYGFARQAGGAERVFVHIKALAADMPRPQKGDDLEFEVVPGRNGRPAANNVRVLRADDIARQLPYHLVTAALLLILAELVVIVHRAPFALVVVYAGMAAVSLYLYSRDKRAALFGMWRIREATLLSVDLAFGIVGGLLAQHRYRHKKSKQSYQIRIFAIVAVHAAFLTALGSGLLSWNMMFGWLLPVG